MPINKSTLCKRMLNKLGMHLEKHYGCYFTMTDKNGYFIYCDDKNWSNEKIFCCADIVDCLDKLLKTKEFYILSPSIATVMSNPFYQKTLEEICIMLDIENI